MKKVENSPPHITVEVESSMDGWTVWETGSAGARNGEWETSMGEYAYKKTAVEHAIKHYRLLVKKNDIYMVSLKI